MRNNLLGRLADLSVLAGLPCLAEVLMDGGTPGGRGENTGALFEGVMFSSVVQHLRSCLTAALPHLQATPCASRPCGGRH